MNGVRNTSHDGSGTAIVDARPFKVSILQKLKKSHLHTNRYDNP